eukprot:730424-Pleurochrysis_carterae.AAC.2
MSCKGLPTARCPFPPDKRVEYAQSVAAQSKQEGIYRCCQTGAWNLLCDIRVCAKEPQRGECQPNIALHLANFMQPDQRPNNDAAYRPFTSKQCGSTCANGTRRNLLSVQIDKFRMHDHGMIITAVVHCAMLIFTCSGGYNGALDRYSAR